MVLIDDNDYDTYFLKRICRLAKLKNPILTADNGDTGIELLRTLISGGVVPALISTDLEMPDHDGFEVIEWVRSQTVLAEVPIVVVSGTIGEANVKRAMDLGAAAFFDKPPSVPEVLSVGARIAPELRFEPASSESFDALVQKV